MQSSLRQLSQRVVDQQRRSWYSTEMRKERTTFTNSKQLTLFAGTWNVNGRPPDPHTDLSKWLFPPSQPSSRPFDVYMLGLQEVQTLQGIDAMRADPTKAAAWRKAFKLALSSDYDHVADRQLVGIFVLVFLRKNHSPYLSDVQLSYAATGFMNAGNKGAVAVRFSLYDRTFACVACHLAAHTSNVDRRTQDFTDVIRKAVFLPASSDVATPSTSYPSALTKSTPANSSALTRSLSAIPSNPLAFSDVAAGTSAWIGSVTTALSDITAGANTTYLNDPNAIKVLDHDIVFWLGDLNYRIDAPLNDVLRWIENRDWESLYAADQLHVQMKKHSVFKGFREGPLRFPPSYKYERFRNEYATDENGEFKRTPAYTDRILWRVGTPDNDPRGLPEISLEDYSSATSVFSSDHRPVFATFVLTVGVEDASKRRTAEEKIKKELDRREANLKSPLQFSSSTIDLGDVFFDKECNRHIVVKNTGQFPSYFSVSNTDTPPWLFFDHKRWQDVEVPANKSLSVPIRVLIDGDNGLANSVASRGCRLQTVLELRSEPGNLRTSFQIHGRYVPTVLGLSLEMLSLLADPVMSLRSTRNNTRENAFEQHLRDIENNSRAGPGIVPLAVPKEIWLLVDALVTIHRGEDQPFLWFFPSLFLKKGDDIEVDRVLSLVDRGEQIPEDVGGYAIGTCLLKVLKYLDDSVIPSQAYKRALEAGHTEDVELVCGLVDLLPPLNRNVFWYIIGFLCEVPLIHDRDERSKDVAAEFGKVLIRSDRDLGNREQANKTAFVMAAIEYHLEARDPKYSVNIDLSNPESHPKYLRKPKR